MTLIFCTCKGHDHTSPGRKKVEVKGQNAVGATSSEGVVCTSLAVGGLFVGRRREVRHELFPGLASDGEIGAAERCSLYWSCLLYTSDAADE